MQMIYAMEMIFRAPDKQHGKNTWHENAETHVQIQSQFIDILTRSHAFLSGNGTFHQLFIDN